MRAGRLLGPILFLAILGGCARVTPPLPTGGPAPPAGSVWTETGIASWYGDPYHGRTTASGEIYDMEAMTAAHRTLPFHTIVLVENLRNGRSTTLRINDRGPFIRGRTLDVSRRAARELDLIGPGTAPVRVTVLDSPAAAHCWEVQVGAFALREGAEELRDRLGPEGLPTRVGEGPDGLHRVRLGPIPARQEADRLASRWNGILMACSGAQ